MKNKIETSTYLNHNGQKIQLQEFSYWRDTKGEHYRIRYNKLISEAGTLREAISGLLQKIDDEDSDFVEAVE